MLNRSYTLAEAEVSELIRRLNQLFLLNPEAVRQLFAVRAPWPHSDYRDEQLTVKALLNDVIGRDAQGLPRIAAIESRAGELQGFCRYQKPPSPPLQTGQSVSWLAQGNGRYPAQRKSGIVIGVCPAGQSVLTLLPPEALTRKGGIRGELLSAKPTDKRQDRVVIQSTRPSGALAYYAVPVSKFQEVA